MSNLDIKKVDKNFVNQETTKELKYLNPMTSDLIKVYGLEWFNKDHEYIRCPKEMKDTIKGLAEGLYLLVEQPAGAMIAFYAETSALAIDVEMGGNFHMAHMAFTGQGGVDLYMGDDFDDLKFFRTASFPINNLKYRFTYFEGIEKKKRLFLLNLPLYASVNKIEIGFDQDAVIEKAELFNKGKVVVYGTSITQGGCASRPGMCYTNILARRLGYEFMNYGFSGNGRGQVEIAEMLASTKNAKLFLLDYEANVTLKMMQDTLDQFIKTIRKEYPIVPIVVMSKVVMPREVHFENDAKAQRKLLNYQKQIVKLHRKSDPNIYFLDGHKLFGKELTEATVDGAHPTDLGFYLISNYLEKYLAKFLS